MFTQSMLKCTFFCVATGDFIAYTTDGADIETGEVLYSTDGETSLVLPVHDYYGTASRHSFITLLGQVQILITRDRTTLTRTDNHTQFKLAWNLGG